MRDYLPLPCLGPGCRRVACGCRPSRALAYSGAEGRHIASKHRTKDKSVVRFAGTVRLTAEAGAALADWLGDQDVEPSISSAFGVAMVEFLERRGYLKPEGGA
jgi:hypothetical protein